MTITDLEFEEKKEASVLRNLIAIPFFCYIFYVGVCVMLLKQPFYVHIIYLAFTLIFLYAVIHEVSLLILRRYVVIKIEITDKTSTISTYYRTMKTSFKGAKLINTNHEGWLKNRFKELRLDDFSQLCLASGHKYYIRNCSENINDLRTYLDKKPVNRKF